MIIVITLVLFAVLLAAFVPLHIASERYRREIARLMSYVFPGLAFGILAALVIRKRPKPPR